MDHPRIALGTEVFVFCGSEMVSWKAVGLMIGQLSKKTLFRGKSIDQAEHLCKTRASTHHRVPIGLLQAIKTAEHLWLPTRGIVYTLS